MKKKYWSLTTLILSIVIVVLCYFTYQKFIYPIYLKNNSKTAEITLNKGKQLLLTKDEKQKNIYAIEIDFKGQLMFNTTIFLCDSVGIPNQQIRLKKGDIDYFYAGDWYSPSCMLKFESTALPKGKLKIDYRFLALN